MHRLPPPFPLRAALLAPLLATLLAAAPAAAGPPASLAPPASGGGGEDPNYVLRAPNVVGLPGTSVFVAVTLDSFAGEIQGWSTDLAIRPPLDIIAATDGSTTSSFNGGAGPDFNALVIHPGEGVIHGVVISFTGAETLSPGTGYELHVIEIGIPASAPMGTSYPLEFVETTGNPPVANVIVVNGQSHVPVKCHGTITVGSPNYCGPAPTNSTGLSSVISADGVFFADGHSLSLTASQMPTGEFGYFLVSATQGFVANPAGSQGNLCLAGTIGRFRSQIQNSGAAGSITIDVDTSALPLSPPHAIVAGETWNFQAWFRDKNPTPTSNFTDAISIFFH